MSRWRSVPLALTVIAMAASLILAGCAGTRPKSELDATVVTIDADSQRQYDRIEQEHLIHRDRQVIEQGKVVLASRPRHPLGDAITGLMIASAVRLPDLDVARDLALAFPERWPSSPHRDVAMQKAATGLAAAGRTSEALAVTSALLSAQTPGAEQDTTVALTAPWLESLATDQLDGFLDSSSPLAPLAGRILTERHRSQGDPAAAAAVVERMERLAPNHAETRRARDLLGEVVVGASRGLPGRLGVLCPLTGRYARFGNAFQAGVRFATGHVEAPLGWTWEMILADTESDPVMAALEARRLCTEEQCQLLVGGLLSSSTATAALVAQQHGVSLISPTATSERLGMLGEHVLQTNLTGQLEAELMARLACEVLLKKSFAVIRPDTPEGASMAAAFTSAVTKFGGTILHEAVFAATATDFRAHVEELRQLRPEVVFAPATVDQMMLLGPQLDFFKVGSLVLGPSEWNSDRLLARAGPVMDRALCAASEMIYPVAWTADFNAVWPRDEYDEETSRVGRSSYLATRLALTTLARDPDLAAGDIAVRMRDALTGREAVEEEGPQRYATTVRMIQDGALVPFPGNLYTEAWHRGAEQRRQAALADSLSAVVDSLGTLIEPVVH